jgi:CubicO group peptidase (beta-lactamase class C family)
MTTRLVAALLAVALAGAAGCPDPTAAAPRPMAAGPHERTRVEGEQGARLDEYLSRTVPFGFSGAVFVTDRRGVLLHKGYGLADVAKGVPITTQTVFDMGSITKAFTAEAVVLLAAERRLSVQDTLGKYFPDAPADKRGLTLEQVLTHTAGLVDLTGDDYDVVTREQLLRDAFAAPLVATPGQAWSYSNAGYSVLAAIVEKVSGQTYEQFLRKRFFAPAGMNQTGYVLPKWDPALVAHTYTLGVDHGSPLERFRRNGGPYWVLLGNGGMLTTSADLYRWEQALRAGRILSFPLQEDLFAPRFKRSENVSQGYAWTIERYPDGLAVHHGGDAPGLGVNAEHRRYREEALTIVVLANTRHKGASTRRSIVPGIRATLLGRDAPLPPAVTRLPPDALKAFEGTYDVAPGAFLTVRAERGGLVVGSSGQEAVDLFTFTRAEASLANRRVRNQKALELVEALRAPSAEPLQALLGATS